MMSLLKYFKPILSTPGTSTKDRLPDLSGCLSKVMPSPTIMACNAEVSKVLDAESQSGAKKSYLKLTPAQRFELGKKQQKSVPLPQCITLLKSTPIWH